MNLILDLFFPKKCVSCKKEGNYFCQKCIQNIQQTDLVCPRCERLAVGGQTHPICRRKYGLDGLWSLGLYQPPLKNAVQALKYKGVKDLAQILIDITLEYWVKYQPFILDQIKKDRGAGWAIVPVPLYWWRGNSRGFNQAALLGQLVSKGLGLAYCNVLKRIRYTKPQVGLKGKDRYQNIHGAFAISPDIINKKVKG